MEQQATERMKEAYRLRVELGLTPIECAQQMNCTPRAFDNLLRRLRESGYNVPRLKTHEKRNQIPRTVLAPIDVGDDFCRCGLRVPCNNCLTDELYQGRMTQQRTLPPKGATIEETKELANALETYAAKKESMKRDQ